MVRMILPVAFVLALAAGCNDARDTKPFQTTSASPSIQLPAGVNLPDSNKGNDKPDPKADKGEKKD